MFCAISSRWVHAWRYDIASTDTLQPTPMLKRADDLQLFTGNFGDSMTLADCVIPSTLDMPERAVKLNPAGLALAYAAMA
jgi:hypothetical protein